MIDFAIAAAAASAFQGYLGLAQSRTEARWAKIQATSDENAVNDLLLNSLAEQQAAAAGSGYQLSGSIATTQLADINRAVADKRMLRLQASSMAARYSAKA